MSAGAAPAETAGPLVQGTPGNVDSAAIDVAADRVHGGAS